MAQAHIPAGRDAPGVPRDHLSHAVHPGPRGLEERAVAASATHPRDAPFSPPHPEDARSWPDQAYGLDPRTSGGAEDRAVPGHWEGDLFFGSHNSQIATLVERQTRYLMLVRVACKDSETVIDALIKQAHKLPRELYKSLTWDRGPEMADHQRFSLATDVKVYFCDPQQPWQRGSNENTNGLLRQYFPKGMDLSDIHQTKLNAIARRLNERPRETLGFETPAERFGRCVALIA